MALHLARAASTSHQEVLETTLNSYYNENLTAFEHLDSDIWFKKKKNLFPSYFGPDAHSSFSPHHPWVPRQRHRRGGFHPWVRKIPWRRKWQPISSILVWKIPTEKPGGLQSMGLQRVYRCHFRNSNLLSSEIRLCVAEHVTMWSGSQKIFSSLVAFNYDHMDTGSTWG